MQSKFRFICAAIVLYGVRAYALSDLITQNLTVTPASGAAGSGVNVSFTIRNNGGTTASASTVNIRLATSSGSVTTGDPLLTSVNVPTVAAGGTYPVSANVTIPSGRATGQNYVWVILDVGSTAGQGAANEANDKSNTPFMVQPSPDGFVLYGVDVSH